jgi:hypothetical protein
MERENAFCVLNADHSRNLPHPAFERAFQTIVEFVDETFQADRQASAPIWMFMHGAGNIHLIQDANNIFERNGQQARWRS